MSGEHDCLKYIGKVGSKVLQSLSSLVIECYQNFYEHGFETRFGDEMRVLGD